MQVKKHRALALFSVLALAACSGDTGSKGDKGDAGAKGDKGDTGATGATGAAGKDLTAAAKPEACEICHATSGSYHQAIYNSFADGIDRAKTKFAISNVVYSSSQNTNGTWKAVVSFTLSNGGVPVADVTKLKQKTIYFVSYAGGGVFPTPATAGTLPNSVSAINFSFNVFAGSNGTFTATRDLLDADPVAGATNAFLYGYFGDTNLDIPANSNTSRHYALMDNMISFAQVLKGTIDYSSTADVTGCEKCHGAPYSKHGYRQATIWTDATKTAKAIPDFAACKACHTSARVGTDHDWQWMADDPAAYAAGTMTKTKYEYVANVMNDTHMSHAMEFEYPQSMASCITCHKGKLDTILVKDNFTVTTCKSCHPVTGTGNTRAGRAPSFQTIFTNLKTATGYSHPVDYTQMYEPYTGPACNVCHFDGAGSTGTFKSYHSGFDASIYKDGTGARYDAVVSSSITTASSTYDATAKKLTVVFKVTGAATDAVIKPTIVGSIYGYETKDFLVSGHGSQTDGKRNLEWGDGSSSNSPRLTVTKSTDGATFTAVYDLSTFVTALGAAATRVEVAFLPNLGLDQTKAPDATTNPYVAIKGVTGTFDLVKKVWVADADSYGKKIVSADKCNKCHDALATTFHTPAYGSAGVVACRLCHSVQNGGSHLEMQSRSIDSYVHAIHSFQQFDMGYDDVKKTGKDMGDSITRLWYDLAIESVYPNFTIFSCESCHNPGTYDVPDNQKSLPGLLSASITNSTWTDREIGVVPSYVVGAGSRACGSCHKSMLINENDANKLLAFYTHMQGNSTQLEPGTAVTAINTNSVLDAAIKTIQAFFK